MTVTAVPVVMFEPHPDDVSLFAAFACLHERPCVTTVLKADIQEQLGGATTADRERENRVALHVLKAAAVAQWDYPESRPDWQAIGWHIAGLSEVFERCYAPAPEIGGHEHHNRVGDLAQQHFGERCTAYLTYRRGHGRSTWGQRVEPEPDWIRRKLRAMSCYRTQVEDPTTRPWFLGPLDEYLCPAR